MAFVIKKKNKREVAEKGLHIKRKKKEEVEKEGVESPLRKQASMLVSFTRHQQCSCDTRLDVDVVSF